MREHPLINKPWFINPGLTLWEIWGIWGWGSWWLSPWKGRFGTGWQSRAPISHFQPAAKAFIKIIFNHGPVWRGMWISAAHVMSKTTPFSGGSTWFQPLLSGFPGDFWPPRIRLQGLRAQIYCQDHQTCQRGIFETRQRHGVLLSCMLSCAYQEPCVCNCKNFIFWCICHISVAVLGNPCPLGAAKPKNRQNTPYSLQPLSSVASFGFIWIMDPNFIRMVDPSAGTENSCCFFHRFDWWEKTSSNAKGTQAPVDLI